VIRRYGRILKLTLMLVDGSLAFVMSLLMYQVVAHPWAPAAEFLDVFWVRASFYAIAWVALLYVHGAYRLRAHWTLLGEAGAIARSTAWLAVLGFVALIFSASDVASSGWALLLFPLQGLLALTLRVAVRIVFMYFRRHGHNVRNLVILGTGPEASAFESLVAEHSVLGIKVIGYLGDKPPPGPTKAPLLGSFEELPLVLRELVVDEVAICIRSEDWHRVEELAQLAHEEGKLVRVPLQVPQLRTSERFVEDLDGTAVLSYSNGPDELTSMALKRVIDVVVGALSMILLAPVVLAIAIWLRISQGPQVIFSQRRVGIHGRVFNINKFRTMSLDAEERQAELSGQSLTGAAAFKLASDPRVTPQGHRLRRFSLDELPQLWNVFRGEMSIVGPRPAPPREVREYDLWHRRRLSMKPGITGLWQITRDYEDFDRRAELDMAYIDDWSIWLDMSIMVRTVPAVLRKPGL
jgi:exopolysaccharide biosynthesis polyprenyl glycosylphosphotransferase